jgi:hypothetical protein
MSETLCVLYTIVRNLYNLLLLFMTTAVTTSNPTRTKSARKQNVRETCEKKKIE